MLETINQVAQVVLAVCAVVATAVAAVGGTRWGKSKAVQVASDALAVLMDVARAAVAATEQEYRHQHAADGEAAGMRQEKATRALGHFFQMLPPGMSVDVNEAQGYIEAAVHEMNAEKSRVDPQ